MNRPMVWVAVGFAAGTLGAAWGYVPGLAVALLVMACGLAVGFGFQRFRPAPAIAVAIAFCGCAAAIWHAREPAPEWDALSRAVLRLQHASESGQPYMTVRGQVVSSDIVLPDESYSSFVVAVDTYRAANATHHAEGRMLIRWPGAERPVYPGQRIEVTGQPSVRIGLSNFRLGDVEDYYRRRGVHSVLIARHDSAVQVVREAPWWPVRHWAARLRQHQAETFARVTPAPALPFALAVWLGDRSQLDRDEMQTYVETGTAHMLAVSGVHVGIVYVSLEFLLGLCIRRRKVRTVVILLSIGLFVLMAGARISSLRAMLMIACYLAADMVDRERDVPTALSLAGIALIAWQPLLLFDVGFLLSFASVLSILLFGGAFADLGDHRAATALSGVRTAFGVQVLPLPLALKFFHVLPVVGPFVNILVVPLLTLVLWVCLLTALTGMVSTSAAALFGHAIYPLVATIRIVVDTASWLVPHYYLPIPTHAAIAAYWVAAGAVALGLWRRDQWRRYAVAGGVAAIAAALLWRPWHVAPHIVFFDVGHGDAALVVTRDERTILIDGGVADDMRDRGKRVIAPYLWSQGFTRVDEIVVSHPDADHIGGLRYVIEHFNVDRVTLGAAESGRESESALIAHCNAAGIPVRRVARGATIGLAGIEAEVLHPPPGWQGDDVNNGSLVFRLWWHGLPVLFTGDIEAEAERRIAGLDTGAAILKVPHHGSATSTTGRFLEAVAPQAAVISTGPTYTGRGVDTPVVNRMAARKIEVFRTDLDGAVQLIPNGGTFTIETRRALPAMAQPAQQQ